MTRSDTLRDHLRGHLKLGLPLVGSHLAQMAIAATDTLMLGWYDARVLAGQVLANVPYTVLFLFLSGFAFAVMPLVSAASEAEDETRIRRVTRMGIWISLGLGLLVMPVFLFARPLLVAAGQEPELASLAQSYLRIMGWGILPSLTVMVLKSYLSALERTRVQLMVTLLAVAVNAAFNWVLIFGHFGAPELGIRGAAIASLSVNIVAALALMLYAARSFPTHRLFHRLWKVDREALSEVFGMGWHIGLTTLAEVAFFSFTTILAGMLGAVVLAAHGIVMQIASFSFMVPLGIANAATVRAGRAWGRGDREALRRGALSVYLLSVGWVALAVVIFLVFPYQMIGAFVGPDDPLREPILVLGRQILVLATLFQLFDAIQVVSAGLLRGMQDTKAPLFIAATSYWLIGAPLAWGLGLGLGFGAVGIWTGVLIGLGVAAVLLTRRFLRHSASVGQA